MEQTIGTKDKRIMASLRPRTMAALLEVIPELLHIALLLLHIPQLHDGGLLHAFNLGLLALQPDHRNGLLCFSMDASPTLTTSLCNQTTEMGCCASA